MEYTCPDFFGGLFPQSEWVRLVHIVSNTISPPSLIFPSPISSPVCPCLPYTVYAYTHPRHLSSKIPKLIPIFPQKRVTNMYAHLMQNVLKPIPHTTSKHLFSTFWDFGCWAGVVKISRSLLSRKKGRLGWPKWEDSPGNMNMYLHVFIHLDKPGNAIPCT